MNTLIRKKVPKTIQWITAIFFIYLFLFTGFRIATAIFFKPNNVTWFNLLPSFWLGLKYDLRWISFILFPICFFSFYKKFSPFYNDTSKKFWTIYLGIITLLLLFFYGADFGQFAYVNARLNADALIFAEDPKESLQMIWQSYPIVWILIALFIAVIVMVRIFRLTHLRVEDNNVSIHKFSFRKIWNWVALLILSWFMYGFFTKEPLNFFRAFNNIKDGFKSNLALNPMQNFFTTLRFRKVNYETKAKEYYPVIKDFLQLDGSVTNNYTRTILPRNNSIDGQPNVVLVICESFSMYKSSMSGNMLNTTPYFNQLSKEGIFFNRCFTPSFGTARGVFALLTGTPDVQLAKFSTRNEEAIKQRCIINDFDGYEKFYFIGGNSEFNNFKGLVENIKDVQIYDQQKFNKPKLNVWGISDNNLFKEANNTLSKQTKPFFAIVQTADNHRPFNIPEEDKDFVPQNVPLEKLKENGFESLKEFNAFSYFDYCVKSFVESAKKEPYFNNTIFVFVGDHGVEGNSNNIYPKAWYDQRLADEHVPLLFYAPGLITPQLRKETVSQIDVLPTIAGMVHQPYTNSTLGRDLLDSSKKQDAAFIIYHAPGWIGVADNNFFYRKNIHVKAGQKQNDELVSITGNELNLTAPQIDSVKKHLGTLTSAIHETAKWLLVNNK
jgi:phosphoglycerol transferase MdoB-like AlkP superfamily enzyme